MVPEVGARASIAVFGDRVLDEFYLMNPQAWAKGTQNLTMEQIGCLLLFVHDVHIHRCEVPDDLRILGHLWKCHPNKARKIRLALLEEGKLATSEGALRLSDTSFIQEPRRYISAAIRRVVVERDGSICAYCRTTSGPFHIDHMIPFSRGGSHDPDNLTVACGRCNLSKGRLTPDEWVSRADGGRA